MHPIFITILHLFAFSLDFRHLINLFCCRTIRSVEEHIKDSVLKEVMSSKSSRNIQIDLTTVEIKRQLGSEIIKMASFARESAVSVCFECDIKINRNQFCFCKLSRQLHHHRHHPCNSMTRHVNHRQQY